MAFGPAQGLAILEDLVSEPSLRSYHLLPSARGDLLAKLSRFEEAQVEFDRAALLARNARDQELLRARSRECAARAAEAPVISRASPGSKKRP